MESTSSTVPVDITVLDLKAFHKMLKAVGESLTVPTTLFFSSDLIDPNACYKMNPQTPGFLMLTCFDRKTKTVYVCGKNVRDALIKKGVAFQNYKEEEEK
jgi:hypothetical protein